MISKFYLLQKNERTIDIVKSGYLYITLTVLDFTFRHLNTLYNTKTNDVISSSNKNVF